MTPEMFQQKRSFLPYLLSHPEIIHDLRPRQQLALMKDWLVWARDSQLEENIPNRVWQHWLLLAGRGYGKSRSGAEWVRKQMVSGNMKRMALISRTPEEARKVMVEGESGILAVCLPHEKPEYQPALKQINWKNGGICSIFSGEKPDTLPGNQFDGYWCDELAKWRFVQETWDHLMMCLRLTPKDGRPRGLITTTPRPIPLVKKLYKEALANPQSGRVFLTRGRTTDNAANIPASRLEEMLEKYEGTRLGRQELEAEILEDDENALWHRGMFRYVDTLPNFVKVVVGVDPQKMSHVKNSRERSESNRELSPEEKRSRPNCETGIIVAGKDHFQDYYVLDDCSLDGKPEVWAQAVCEAYFKYHAECVVAEANAGGQMVQAVIQNYDPRVRVELVTASRGQTKHARAQPISTLYERGKVFHFGHLPYLEDQQVTWNPHENESPDRIDAAVWALWHLSIELPWDDGDRSIRGITRRAGW